ncbi:MAG: hypothetical protein D6761_01310 [Candidatus Dadabacteria bacterium]|nr:MAG: hypothetical protein D6761_01310 [Candidatus Dadabacteria bacterium]
MKRFCSVIAAATLSATLPGCVLFDFLNELEQRTQEELVQEAPAELGVVDLAVQGILGTLMFGFETLGQDASRDAASSGPKPMAALAKAAIGFRPAQSGTEQQTIDCLDGGTLAMARSAETLPNGRIRYAVRVEANACGLPAEAPAAGGDNEELPLPTVERFEPNPVTAGGELHIVGRFFALDLSDAAIDEPTLQLLRIEGGTIAERIDATSDVTAWSFDRIVLTVPENVTTGTYLVDISNGLFSAPSRVALGVGTAPTALSAPPRMADDAAPAVVEWLNGFVELSVEGTGLDTSSPDISRFGLDADLVHEIRAGTDVWSHDAWEGLSMHGAADDQGRLGIQVEGTLRNRTGESQWFLTYENADLALQMDERFLPELLDFDGKVTIQGGTVDGGNCIDGTWRISTLLPIEIGETDACPAQGSVMVNDFEYTFISPTEVEISSGPNVVTVNCGDAVGEFSACMGRLIPDEGTPEASTSGGTEPAMDMP